MTCDDECAADKAEAKEWAYFSGITTGRLGERKRIVGILENVQTIFADSVTSPQKELMDGILNQVVTYLLKEISGGKK
jgi:hypothetical protein